MCIRNVISNSKGWRHEAYLGKVIEGQILHWLAGGRVKNGNRSIQANTKLTKPWENIIVMMGRYHLGSGVKTIGKEFGYSGGQVLYALKEAGIDTTKRRNYSKPSDSLNRIQTAKIRYQKAMTIPSNRLKKRVMTRIWRAMKDQKVNSSGSFSIIGCSVEFLKSYIENKFEQGMSWNNYGEWHVDHIRPCASFDLSQKDQMLECFNWRNLQPMWASQNISKGSKYAQA